MLTSVASELDLIEELRLRRWARENYVPHSQREKSWHRVVLDEMGRKDDEGGADQITSAQYAWMKS